VEEFREFLQELEESTRTIALVCVCFGLRISECLALKWNDIDWLNGKLRIERAIVRQQVDDVKTIYSGKMMAIDAGMLEMLKTWRQRTQFSGDGDWVFASTLRWDDYRSPTLGLEIVSDGRGESWDWQAGHAQASSQLPFMVGRGWNCGRRSAKAYAALGHPNGNDYL